jgi:protein-S-isoprenylcysteine O-methyltransferase Ste14
MALAMKAGKSRSENVGGKKMKLKVLVGSGHRIMLLALPFLAAGLILNTLFPSWFSVGGPPLVLKAISILVLVPGVTIWMWSVVLILTRVPKQELITDGPYSLVKHPLYTAVALLVLPWIGFLLNTWLGAPIGIVLYIGARAFAPEEERGLSKTFGATWDEYCRKVKVAWL